MFKSLSRKTVMGLVALGLSGGVFPTGLVAVSSSTFQAEARIIGEALISTSVEDLDFGQISLDDDGDDDDGPPVTLLATVILTADTGIRSVVPPGGDVTLTGGSNFNRARFLITGEANVAYTININPTVIEAHDAGQGGPPLTVDPVIGFSQNGFNEGFNGPDGLIVINGGSIIGQGFIGADGTDTVFIAGNMQVTSDAKSGGYIGVVTMEVAY